MRLLACEPIDHDGYQMTWLVTVEREKAFLRYRANTSALEQLLGFFYSECCTRNRAVEPRRISALCR